MIYQSSEFQIGDMSYCLICIDKDKQQRLSWVSFPESVRYYIHRGIKYYLSSKKNDHITLPVSSIKIFKNGDHVKSFTPDEFLQHIEEEGFFDKLSSKP